MLVLTRKLHQSMRVGDAIVTVVEILPDGRVRLGITAPKEVPIWRSEIDEGQKSRVAAKEVHAAALNAADQAIGELFSHLKS